MGHVGPTSKEKEKKRKKLKFKTNAMTDGTERVQRSESFFLVFIIFSSFSDLRKLVRRISSG